MPIFDRTLAAILVATFALSLPPITARAADTAPPADGDRAREHFERGVSLFEDGDYESALFEFETAFDSSDNPHLLYNIAVSQYELHRYAEATVAYRKYLDRLEDQLPAERLAKVRKQLKTLDLRVGTLIVDSDPPGAVVTSGGRALGVTPLQVTLDLGEVQLRLEKEGFRPTETEARVIGGDRTSIEVELAESEGVVDVPPPRVAMSADAPRGDEDSDSRVQNRGLKIGTWVALGVAGGVGAAAAVTGALAIGANDDLDAARGRQTDRAELDDLGQRRDTLALTTDVLVGVAAAAAVTSLVLGITLLTRRRDDRRSTRLDPTTLTVRF